MGVAARLGVICRQARRDAHLSALDVAQTAGVSETMISRFERGERWPRDIDAVVAAYEKECGLPCGELWRRAVGCS